MKKILFLLLITVSSYGQTYPVNPTKFGKISLNTNGVTTSTSRINSQNPITNEIDYIDAVNLPVPTTVTNALDLKKNATSTAITSTLTITNNGATFSVSAFTGKIVNNSTVPATVTNINFAGANNVTPMYFRTILYVNTAGSLIQFNGATSDLSPLQRVDNIFIGLVVYSGGVVQVVQTTPDIEYAIDNRFAALGAKLRNINEGNNISPNGANLQINKGAGTTWRLGSNFATNRKVPDETVDVAQTPIPAGVNLIGYRNGSGGWSYQPFTGSITPDIYDNNTGIPVAVSNNKFTNIRDYFFNGTNTHVFYLGRAEYSTLEAAVAVAEKPDAIVDPATSVGSLIGTISVQKGVTALTNPLTYQITQGPRQQGGASSGGTSGTQNLQSTYLNSLTPQITTTPALGAVSIRNGSASDANNIFTGQNIAGTNTFSVTGAGNITGGTYNGYTPENISNKATDFTTVNNTLYPTVQAVDDNYVNKDDTEGLRLDQSLLPIDARGDSLTQGTGGTPYPTTLTTLAGFSVTNKGVGGETSTQIKDRMIADVASYSKSVIIWAGRNNYSDPNTVKSDIATMIAALGHTRYLVVSIINGNYPLEYINQPNWVTITTLNNDLKALYGDKFVNMREFLVSQHNQTSQDLIDFSNDIPPTSLRSDNIHLNTAGYNLVAEFLNKKLGYLYGTTGYFQSKDFQYYLNAYLGTGTNSYIPKWDGSGRKLVQSQFFDYTTGVGVGGILSQPTGGLFFNVNGGIYSQHSGGSALNIRTTTNGGLTTPLDSEIAWYKLSGLKTASINCSDASTNVGGVPMIFSTRGNSTTILERARFDRVDGAFLINTTTNDLVNRLQVVGGARIDILDLSGTSDTSTTATHYFVETATDGKVRPKTLANVRSEIVTNTSIDAAKPNIALSTNTVNLIGAQTISDVKTFSDSPIVPTATTSGQAVNKGQLDLKADLASPTFTGTPIAPTATVGTNTAQIATTAFVLANSNANGLLEYNSFGGTVWNNGRNNISENTSFGENALTSSTLSGNYNTAYGGGALRYLTSGSNNLAIGNLAGAHSSIGLAAFSTGSNSVFIGNNTKSNGDGNTNEIVIGHNATGNGSNTTTIGNSSTVKTYLKGTSTSLPATIDTELATLGQVKSVNAITYTVSTLPTPTGTASRFAIVTDATAPTYLGTLTGGGSVVCPVFYNGTSWVSH